jgi:hypothetical protein
MDTPPPPAPPPPPVPLPRIVGHDDNGNFILELETGTYFGPIKDGVPHGVGRKIFKSSNVFIGRWENGKRVKGTTTLPDGRQFTGVWVNDSLYNGFGTASYANGDTFTGEWKEGRPYRGEGFVHYSSGVFEGEILEGNMHGKGKLTLNNGDIFEGQWENDKLNGKGEYRNKRTHYIGDFLDDKKHGRGKLVLLSDNSIYDGDFKNNMKKGKGKIIYKDGSSYEGDWDNDMKHGEGKLTDAKGKITFGLWKYNDLSKEYPIFKISEKVLIGCETILGEPYKSDDIIMLHNPPIPTFDITRTFDCAEKCTLNICNFMFTREDIKGLKKLAVDNEVKRLERQGMRRIDYAEINENVIMRNPHNRQEMPTEHLQLCVLSIIPSLPPSLLDSLPASLPASLDLFSAEPKEGKSSASKDESIEGGKRKRKRKQTIKRKQKSKRIQSKKKTKRNLH